LKISVIWDVVLCSLVKVTDVSEVLAASIFIIASESMVQHPRRQSSTYRLATMRPEISFINFDLAVCDLRAPG
jgi:hypothetical protein